MLVLPGLKNVSCTSTKETSSEELSHAQEPSNEELSNFANKLEKFIAEYEKKDDNSEMNFFAFNHIYFLLTENSEKDENGYPKDLIKIYFFPEEDFFYIWPLIALLNKNFKRFLTPEEIENKQEGYQINRAIRKEQKNAFKESKRRCCIKLNVKISYINFFLKINYKERLICVLKALKKGIQNKIQNPITPHDLVFFLRPKILELVDKESVQKNTTQISNFHSNLNQKQ